MFCLQSNVLIIVLAIAAGLGLIALFFISLLWLFSKLGGWSHLNAHYACKQPIMGKTYSMQSARFGWVNYNNILTFIVHPDGLYIVPFVIFKPFHPALLIPWQAINTVTTKSFFFTVFTVVHVQTGNNKVVIHIPQTITKDANWQGVSPVK